MKQYAPILVAALFFGAGCHRPEIITAIYTIPALDSEQKVASLTTALNTQLPSELHQIKADIQAHTLTVSFHEQLCRTMNVEQIIAETGFAVNNRPKYVKSSR